MGMLLSSDALAQRDAGAKARGEFGKGFWNSGSNRASTRVVQRTMVPQARLYQTESPQAVDSYRSFSYEPTPGDTADAQNIEEPAAVQVDTSASPCQKVPNVTYRRFSYEPAAILAPERGVRRNSANRRASPPDVRLHPGSRSY